MKKTYTIDKTDEGVVVKGNFEIVSGKGTIKVKNDEYYINTDDLFKYDIQPLRSYSYMWIFKTIGFLYHWAVFTLLIFMGMAAFIGGIHSFIENIWSVSLWSDIVVFLIVSGFFALIFTAGRYIKEEDEKNN